MSALTPIASAEALVLAIQKSGLLTAEAVEQVRQAAAHSPDPKQLARELVKDGTLTKWQAEQLLHGFHRLVIGKYKLLNQLGTAPTGRLYLAEHAQMGRRHTLKVLAKRLASNPQAVKQFISAAQNACGLDHRNISHVYDVNQDHERQSHYVVMEYVEGEDLEDLLQRNGRLQPLDALHFILQAAEGLAHAHGNGVVHGDLKPSNLLLDPTGTIKILEMGQAGTGAPFESAGVDESTELAALSAVIFQPPELRGDGETPDVSSDVYSLGSVLCFLLTGSPAPDAAAAVKQLQESGAAGAELIDLCSRMMADKPTGRPRSMAVVVEQLVAIARPLATPPKQAKPESSESRIAAAKKGEPAAASPSPASAAKPKKPPVAKSLDVQAPLPIVITGLAQAAVDVAPPEPFVIKTRGRIGKKPTAKPKHAATEPGSTPVAGELTIASPATTMTPLVLASAIGGGAVLVLGLLIAVVCLLLVGRGDTQVAKNTMTAAPTAAAASAAGPTDVETNPEAPAGERNPEVNATVAAEEPAVAAEPASGAPLGAKTSPLLEGTPEPTAEPKPEPPPAPKAPPKAAPPAKTAPQPAAKPAPFQGLAKAVSLPALFEAGGQPASEARTAAALGPIALADDIPLTVALLGGESAVRGTRHKFEMQAKADRPRSWDFLMSGVGMPSSIATLNASDGILRFQWTEEGVKQAAIAKQLCNCALALTAGSARHIVALRTAILGAPLVVEIEKPATVKWNIGDLPLGKQVFVEVTRVEGPKATQVEPKQAVVSGEMVTVWAGETAKSLPLAIKLDSSSNAREVEIKQLPHVKLEGQEPRVYRRKEMLTLHQQSMQQLELIDPEINRTKASRPTREVEKKLKEQKIDTLSKQKLQIGNVLEQINYATGFAEKHQGTAIVQLRVYYQAGEAQVDLLRTEEAPPAGKK
jgi:serine/threonine protein kinase